MRYALFAYGGTDMPRKPDITIIGKTFSNLRVDKLTNDYDKHHVRFYECTCLICGSKIMVTKQNLKQGRVKDCGKHHIYRDITNMRFGKLKALYVTDKKGIGGNKIWHCICECGNECDIPSNDLLAGKTKSCGCIKSEKMKQLYDEGTIPCKLVLEKLRKTNTSGITGVWYNKNCEKWQAEIMFKRKKYYLGVYAQKEDAISVRKIAEKELFGNFLKWYAKEYPEQWERMNRNANKRI